ncbi:MAG: molybdenum ABC transporter ATP-binding protein [Dehalococcoidia bacterium]|nr:molybdenum ABC transporter ATP-binding protein [Dehalococcoidia bacterium]
MLDTPFLDLRVRKTWGAFRLSVDVHLPSGITVLFGPSGSGKTTILDSIAGLMSPDEGEIRLKGRVLFSSSAGVNLPPERRGVGYVFQDGLLFPHLTVWDNVLYGYRLTPLERRRINPRRLVELLELDSLLERRPATLSGGERQRVALARALATSPEMLLLDEPLASLHAALRGRILRYLRRVHRELAIPMVYVSHSISEALALGDKVLALAHGAQQAFDKPRRVLVTPGAVSAEDVGALENLVDAVVAEHRRESDMTRLTVDGADLWVSAMDAAPGRTITVSIRAGDIIIAPERPGRISARNVLPARIAGVHPVGNRVLVYAAARAHGADVGVPLTAEITRDALAGLGLREGQDVFLIIKSSSIMVLE